MTKARPGCRRTRSTGCGSTRASSARRPRRRPRPRQGATGAWRSSARSAGSSPPWRSWRPPGRSTRAAAATRRPRGWLRCSPGCRATTRRTSWPRRRRAWSRCRSDGIGGDGSGVALGTDRVVTSAALGLRRDRGHDHDVAEPRARCDRGRHRSRDRHRAAARRRRAPPGGARRVCRRPRCRHLGAGRRDIRW